MRADADTPERNLHVCLPMIEANAATSLAEQISTRVRKIGANPTRFRTSAAGAQACFLVKCDLATLLDCALLERAFGARTSYLSPLDWTKVQLGEAVSAGC